jgi:serine/threonine-protein kinase
MRLALTFSPEAPLKAQNRVDLALSPDGTRLVYVGGDKQRTQLYVRDLSQLESNAIPGTELPGVQEGNPFFSPDGQWIGFFAEGKLKKVALSGGSPIVLCDAPTGRGGSWGEDDFIVFAPSLTSGLSRIPAAGGVTEVLSRPDPKKGEVSHRWPQVLPGAEAVLFTIGTGGSWNSARIAVQSLKTGERKVVVEGGFFPRYLPTGHLTFARGAHLMAVPLDLARRETKGTPIPVLDGLETNKRGVGGVELVFSRAGSLLYLPAELPDRSIVWVNRSGTVEPLAAPARTYDGLALSPGGDRIALLIDDGSNEDVWVFDVWRGTLTRLTFGGQNEGLLWTPDGSRITFSSVETGGLQNVVWVPADGSGEPERLTTGEGGWQWPRSWSPDGRLLVFNATHPATDYDIWLLSLGDRPEARPFLQTPFDERDAALSPDGRWVAYQSSETGRPEVYVQAFPGPGGKQQISSDGGLDPVWARSGRELFYRQGNQGEEVMVVDVETRPALPHDQAERAGGDTASRERRPGLVRGAEAPGSDGPSLRPPRGAGTLAAGPRRAGLARLGMPRP